jgi:hypothetical protein
LRETYGFLYSTFDVRRSFFPLAHSQPPTASRLHPVGIQSQGWRSEKIESTSTIRLFCFAF